MNKTFLVTAIT